VIRKFQILSTLFLSLIVFSCKDDSVEVTTKKFNSNSIRILPEIPKSILFFGNKIQLRDEDIRERLDREIIINVYFQSSTTFALKRANRYFPEIEKILAKENVPDDFKYLAVIESNLIEVSSPAGANGFWQFMPNTAKEYGLVINEEIDERLNLTKSTHAACSFIKKSNSIFDDWINACASYNRGINGLQSDMDWQHTHHYFDTDMNNETGRYVFRIMAMKLIMENPELYGFKIPKSQLYKPFKTKRIKLKKEITNMANWAVANGVNLKIVRKLNPWLTSNKLTINPSNYTIQLPMKSENLKNFNSYR
jgi:hypothetical protein